MADSHELEALASLLTPADIRRLRKVRREKLTVLRQKRDRLKGELGKTEKEITKLNGKRKPVAYTAERGKKISKALKKHWAEKRREGAEAKKRTTKAKKKPRKKPRKINKKARKAA